MGKVFIDITISLDGFIAGPDISEKNPMGKGGGRLHNWLFSEKTDADTELSAEQMKATGAAIIGRRMYETAIDGVWEGQNPFDCPVFVLTEQPPTKTVEGFTYVSDGIQSALAQAQKIAGGKDVFVTAGSVSQQYLKAGLVDELRIHIAPVLFMQGTKLFENLGNEHIELQVLDCVQTPGATHIRYKILK